MTLTAIDWAIVVAYFALSTLIGFLFTKRGGESLDQYFLSRWSQRRRARA